MSEHEHPALKALNGIPQVVHDEVVDDGGSTLAMAAAHAAKSVLRFEAIPALEALIAERDALRADRDELLAAVRGVSLMEQSGALRDFADEPWLTRVAAIAKATRGQR